VEHLQDTGEKVVREAGIRRYSYPFTSISGFVCAEPASGVTPISTSHGRVGDLLERNGFAVERISSDEPMWLYCRHKQATSGILRATRENEVQISMAALAQRFGLDIVQTEHYISNARTHDYGLAKRTFSQRARVWKALIELDRRIADSMKAHDEAHLDELRRERSKVAEELSGLTECVVGDPERDRRPGRAP